MVALFLDVGIPIRVVLSYYQKRLRQRIKTLAASISALSVLQGYGDKFISGSPALFR
jgi:hypothetical protein